MFAIYNTYSQIISDIPEYINEQLIDNYLDSIFLNNELEYIIFQPNIDSFQSPFCIPNVLDIDMLNNNTYSIVITKNTIPNIFLFFCDTIINSINSNVNHLFNDPAINTIWIDKKEEPRVVVPWVLPSGNDIIVYVSNKKKCFFQLPAIDGFTQINVCYVLNPQKFKDRLYFRNELMKIFKFESSALLNVDFR